jgi:dCTP deaminase
LEVPPDCAGNLWLRTSYIRKGLIAGFGMVDAGFKGNLTVSISNMGPEKVAIPIGDRLFQIVFSRLSTLPKKLYAERSGTYQGQTGVTLEGGRRV